LQGANKKKDWLERFTAPLLSVSKRNFALLKRAKLEKTLKIIIKRG
jgi:hypothetical protein